MSCSLRNAFYWKLVSHAAHIESKLQAPPLPGDTTDHDTTRARSKDAMATHLTWDEWRSPCVVCACPYSAQEISTRVPDSRAATAPPIHTLVEWWPDSGRRWGVLIGQGATALHVLRQ